jgi:hypothetical protein
MWCPCAALSSTAPAACVIVAGWVASSPAACAQRGVWRAVLPRCRRPGALLARPALVSSATCIFVVVGKQGWPSPWNVAMTSAENCMVQCWACAPPSGARSKGAGLAACSCSGAAMPALGHACGTGCTACTACTGCTVARVRWCGCAVQAAGCTQLRDRHACMTVVQLHCAPRVMPCR